MQIRDPHKFFGLNTDDNPSQLPEGDYPFAKNVRTQGSDEQHGQGPAETLQSEIPVLIAPDDVIMYYGDAIGGDFIYSGWAEVVIGTQTWMKKNYDVDYPGSKVYDDDEDNEAVYGRLYTHNQIMSSDFCPVGWHVPTEAEWDTLVAYLLGEALAGGKLKNVGTALWESPNTGADDESGFRAVPGGKFDALFDLLGLKGLLWLADDGCPLAPELLNPSEITYESFRVNWKASDGATGYYLDVSESPVFASFMMGYEDKDVGNVLTALVEDLEPYTMYYFRLRAYTDVCLSDDSVTGLARTLSALKDLDGNIYLPKTIGTQQWIGSNFKCTKYANGDAIPNITDAGEWVNGWIGGAVAPLIYDSNVSTGVGAATWTFGQTFTLDASKIINKITFTVTNYNTKVGSPNFNIRLSLYNTESGLPTTKIVGTDSLNVIAASIWGTESHEFTFNDIELPAGQYAFVFSYEDIILHNSSNYIKYGIGGNDYDEMFVYNAGSSWTEIDSCMDVQIDFQAPVALDGAYCWYDNDSATYKEDYGALYNWYAVDHASGLAYLEREGVQEAGWRVPTVADFLILCKAIDPNFVNNALAIVGGLLKEVGIIHWNSPNLGAVDYVGFKAVGAGVRDSSGTFISINEVNALWSSLASSVLEAYYMALDAGVTYINPLNIPISKVNGFSVRLVRDITEPPIDKSQIGDAEFRIMVRDGSLCWDKAITGLGFNGVEDQDWINIKSIT